MFARIRCISWIIYDSLHSRWAINSILLRMSDGSSVSLYLGRSRERKDASGRRWWNGTPSTLGAARAKFNRQNKHWPRCRSDDDDKQIRFWEIRKSACVSNSFVSTLSIIIIFFDLSRASRDICRPLLKTSGRRLASRNWSAHDGSKSSITYHATNHGSAWTHVTISDQQKLSDGEPGSAKRIESLSWMGAREKRWNKKKNEIKSGNKK